MTCGSVVVVVMSGLVSNGQGYNGASNMKGDIKKLKLLIIQESSSSYYVHCFAHQLQLILIIVAKDNTSCVLFLGQVFLLL